MLADAAGSGSQLPHLQSSFIMRFATVLALASLGSLTTARDEAVRAPAPPARVSINDNRSAAGTLGAGVLTVHLEVREGEWHPDADSAPGIRVRAFAERGKPASVPGPLLRVREGTEIHASVTNPLAVGTLIVHGLSPRGAAVEPAADTVQIAAGATRDLRFVAGAAGSYYYWGEVRGVAADSGETRDAELSGAFIVDPRDAPASARDRVFLIALWNRGVLTGGIVGRTTLLRFTINGRSWPNTERLTYAVGDTARFRLLNTSAAPHPMHLHGFYFDVNSRGNGTTDSVYASSASRQRVVTERLAPGRTATITWVPERAGNWLFHCHDNYHVLRNAPFDGTPLPPEQLVHPRNHTLEMMGGLVMGIEVRGRDAHPIAAVPESARRQLRLVVREDAGGTMSEPAYGYVLQEGATSIPASGPLLPGPTIMLERGKPVSITVKNELGEATAVHWHGIELESYFDGVAGFSGSGTHVAPAIAPGDSFVARFTPPRSGTFMYHPHADETRQQQAGLSGALLVVDSLSRYDHEHDRVVLLTVPRSADEAARAVLINGTNAPDTLRLAVGGRYRLRIVDLHVFRPSMIVRLVRDSTPVAWRALAKDGMDLPPDRATTRRAIQQMGNGETYDFEITPTERADLRLTVSSGAGVLLAAMPVRVR
jgi:FtsP/CotA-like multicopper oxidase with cupredoxin domain